MGRTDFSVMITTIQNGVLENAKVIETIPHKADDTIEHMFLDISGQHLIITTNSGDAIYLNTFSSKHAKISSLQGSVESVAFGRDVENDMGNRSFLVGTTAGTIYELVIDAYDREKSCLLVFQLNQPLAVTSLFYDYLGQSNTTEKVYFSGNEVKRLYILFATSSPTRLYHIYTQNFVSFKLLFEQSNMLSYIELPGDIRRAVLHCYGTRSRSSSTQIFALMTESGVYHGSITFPVSRAEEVAVEAQLLPYAYHANLSGPAYEYSQSHIPLSIAPTMYHFLLLSVERRLQIVNKLNGEVVSEYDEAYILKHTNTNPFGNNKEAKKSASGTGHFAAARNIVGNRQSQSLMSEQPLGFVVDFLAGEIYLYTENSVLKIELVDEARNNWKIYLKKAIITGEEVQFDYAVSCCINKEDKQHVLRAKAEYYFMRNDLKTASVQLGRGGGLGFDEAVLRILGVSPLVLDLEINQFLQRQQLKLSDSNTISRQSQSSAVMTYNMFGVIDNIIHETDIDQTNLRLYLMEVLNALPASSKSQRTMLATWICEIFIHEITCKVICDSMYENKMAPKTNSNTNLAKSLKQSVQSSVSNFIVNGEKLSIWDYLKTHVPSFKQSLTDMDTDVLLEDEFREFLTNNRSVLDRSVTFAQLQSRGGVMAQQGALLYYAQSVSDYERVVSQLIGEKKYAEAIALLDESQLENVENLVYKWSPLLIAHEPALTVNMIMCKPKLKAVSLQPALLHYCNQYDKNVSTDSNSSTRTADIHYGLMYFENYYTVVSGLNIDMNSDFLLIQNTSDASLYHTYVWMACKYDGPNEERIIRSLQLESDPVNDLLPMAAQSLNPQVDYDFVLRQCQQFKRRKSLIFVYILLNLVEEAADVALTVDIDIAKNIACRHNDNAVRKKLWLKVAIFIMAKENSPQKGLALIKESNGALTIQDLLPHLPDATEIDSFKDEICQALEDCNSHIDALRQEMQELSDSSAAVTKELEAMRKRGYYLNAHQQCEYCAVPLFSRLFYIFPCTHGFHADCLIHRIHTDQWLDTAQLVAMTRVEEQIRQLKEKYSEHDKKAHMQLEYLQNELDGYVAAECPYCGIAMISSIGQSLLAKESEAEILSWAL